MINTIKTITAMTMKIPTPIPALKMPSTTSQLENKETIKINKAIDCISFFMMV
jgi:hypothetical protein